MCNNRAMTQSRKVLISPGFGAGWSTWADGALKHDMLFDAKLIAAVEDPDVDIYDGALDDFVARMKAKHGADTHIYTGGAHDLRVVEVEGQFHVDEYDGSESLCLRNDDKYWV